MIDKNLSILLHVMLPFFLLLITCGCTTNKSAGFSKPTLTPEPTYTPKPLWRVSDSVDEMTGEQSFYSISQKIPPTNQMSFPYDDVVAWIGVGCSGTEEWAYIGFSTAPNLTNDETKDGYDKIYTRIKWDDSIDNATFLQDWGDNFLNFYDFQGASEMINKLQNHGTLLLELEWYGEGNVYFKFPLEGAKESINSIRIKCSGS